MKNEDLKQVGFKSQSELINIIGIGIFLLLTIKGFYFLIDSVYDELLLVTSMPPILILWLGEILSFLTFCCCFLLLMIKIKKILLSDNKERLIFNRLIIAFILTQILQYLNTSVILYLPDEYFTNSDSMYDLIERNSTLKLISIFFEIATYIFIVIVLKLLSISKGK